MSEFDKYNAETVFKTQAVRDLCSQLALALRAAAAHGLSEGVCNHMSMAVPETRFFLLNPRGMLWSEVRGKDIVIVDESGTKLAGLHQVERTAMHIHAAIHRIANKKCVMHTHMPYSTALTVVDCEGADHPFNTMLSQNSMRFHKRVGVDNCYNGFASDVVEGERIARSMADASGGYHDVLFLGNHGVVVCGDRIDHTYVDLYYLERACQLQVLAMSTGRPLRPVADEAVAMKVQQETADDVKQSELFFLALRRTLG
ncbi:unnamed protein product [Ectocarpus fasciculatus]